ncbi:MAG: GNAT family N-acetyltransferase [Planctomycetota bacterium]
MKVEVVPLEQADRAELAQLWNEVAAPESEMYRTIGPEEFAERLEGRVGVAADIIITAHSAGRLVGFAAGCARGLVDEEAANLAAIVVRPGERGEGVGAEILARFEEVARERGARRALVSPASHVRFAFGVDPRTEAYRWLWGRGYSVRQIHLYMRRELAGWEMSASVRRRVERLQDEGFAFRLADKEDTEALLACARTIREPIAQTLERNAQRRTRLPVLIAARRGRVAGFVGAMWVTRCGIADFDLIAVASEERGKGIGTALFSLAVEHFAREGATVLELMTEPTNAAQKIYFEAGFRHPCFFASFQKELWD